MLCKFLSVFLWPIADDDDDCGVKDNDHDDADNDEEWSVGVGAAAGPKLIKRQSNFDNLQVEEKTFRIESL